MNSRESWTGPDIGFIATRLMRGARNSSFGFGASGGIGSWSAPVAERKFTEIYDVNERAVRDLPWSSYRATVFVEIYRVKCSDCGVRREKVPLLPTKAPFSKRFEDAVGLACEMASARQVARQFGLAASTVRAIDLRYLERWDGSRRKPALRQMGVDEIYLGKKEKFLSVVCNLETGEPLWFG